MKTRQTFTVLVLFADGTSKAFRGFHTEENAKRKASEFKAITHIIPVPAKEDHHES
jgi:hypothetical protein